jgi:hypothetical protein
VIPGNAFLAQAPSAGVPVYILPKPVVLSYKEGDQSFTPVDRVPPFTMVALARGGFEAALLTGDGALFGTRAELRRTGIYGAILIDRLNFNVATIQLTVEHCPDVTQETDEASVPVVLTSEEACPRVTLPTEETSVPVLTLEDV